MTRLANKPFPQDTTGFPIAPTLAEWEALSPAAQDELIRKFIIAMAERVDLMAEGRQHSRAKGAALDRLGQHFARAGRRIYLASELAVLYPGEESFIPDVMAVLEVDDPGDDDERNAWVVAREGKGLDLALEILYAGDRNKDLVRNVAWYARLGISEYFVYDRRFQTLTGYRLPEPTATRYRKLRPRFGRLTSQVLGLDLLIAGGRLRFFAGPAEVPGSAELIDQLGHLVDELQEKAEAEQARAEAEQARAEAEQARAEAERKRADELETRMAELQLHEVERLRTTVLRLLEQRGLEVTARLRGVVAVQTDADILVAWAIRAATVATADDILLG